MPQAKFAGFQIPLAKIFQAFRTWILLHSPSLGLLANPIAAPPGGGGRTPGNSWWGYAARFSKSWPYFRPKKCNFPYPFSDLALRQKLCYNYIGKGGNKKIIQIHSVVPSKTIPDPWPKWAKRIPVLRPKGRNNPTRWGCRNLYIYVYPYTVKIRK